MTRGGEISMTIDIYRQCAEDREKLNIKVSDNPLYPEYLAAVSARNESATALLGSSNWDLCWDIADAGGFFLDEPVLISQANDGYRENLLDRYVHTDSVLVKRLIARELKEGMARDQSEGQKGTVADLYRRNLSPKDIQEEAKQFDRIIAYANLTNNTEKRVFSLLERYGTLVTQSNRHYSACCQEAEQQGIKKEETASYALFQEVLKERQEMASVIQKASKPSLIAGIAEDMGVSLQTLNKDRQAYDRGLSSKPKEEDIEVLGKSPLSVPANELGDKSQDKPLQKDDLSLAKREQFEQGRISLNQEWIEKFHFYQTYKRFPNPDELADTWWQAERLTAIEGRLYHQNLKQGISKHLETLRNAARKEFIEKKSLSLSNLSVEVQRILKTAPLREFQIAQVEEHILFYQDKTGEDPTAINIQEIIEVVKMHTENMDNYKGSDDISRLLRPYVQLMEQQKILADRTKYRSLENGKEVSGYLDNKHDKISKLNLQITRSLQLRNDCQQREIDRGRGMET